MVLPDIPVSAAECRPVCHPFLPTAISGTTNSGEINGYRIGGELVRYPELQSASTKEEHHDEHEKITPGWNNRRHCPGRCRDRRYYVRHASTGGRPGGGRWGDNPRLQRR